jgi:hypothetical protein
VTNVFILDYEARLRAWATLREKISQLPIVQKCVEIDAFWQRVPLMNHYLHVDYINDWPGPWQLISDNTYCYYSRALGMIYTLILSDTKNIELVEAKDDNSNEVVLVLVDNAKYVLNYWPDTVVNNLITDFKITRTLDITPLYNKIG